MLFSSLVPLACIELIIRNYSFFLIHDFKVRMNRISGFLYLPAMPHFHKKGEAGNT